LTTTGGQKMRMIDDEYEINLLDYWRVIIKRKWVIISFVGALVFFTAIFSFKATPKYKATATLMIEEEASKILSIEDEFGYRQRFADLRFFNTQLKLLKSKSLIERVARKMDLLTHPLFAKVTANNDDDNDKGKAIPRNPYSKVSKILLDRLEVSPIRDTKLVEVSFTSPNPVFAADLVNTLADEFVEFYIEKRYQTTRQASEFLAQQIEDLKKRLAAKEEELQKYSQEKDLFFLNEQESAAVSKFADLNNAYTQAQIERVKAEANYRELSKLEIDTLPQFLNNKVLEDLRTEYIRLKNEYDEKSKIFKPEYPEMVKLRAKIESMRAQLEGEIKKAVKAAETDYRAALKKEESLRKLLEQQKADVAQMNSNAILYNSLKIEVENMRKLLNSLEEKQKQTLVSTRLGELKTSNISIIDRAEPPLHPVSPKKKLNLILAFVIGLFGGVGLCFVLEYLDNTVKGPEDAEKLVGLPSLGIVPFLPKEGLKKLSRKGYYYRYHYQSGEKDGSGGVKANIPEVKEIELINFKHPNIPLSEDYRTIRTSILLSSAGGPPKSIVVTSSFPQEGKTATVVNLAISFAQLEQKVLLVDADMRKPRIHQIFGEKTSAGLSSYLTGKTDLDNCLYPTKIKNLDILPCGPIPPNPTELIDSEPMKNLVGELTKKYDMVLFDSPPILVVVDSIILSTLTEATILVILSGKTTDKALITAVEELKKAKTRLIGAVFNGVRVDKEDYYYYSRSYRPYYQRIAEEKQEEIREREI